MDNNSTTSNNRVNNNSATSTNSQSIPTKYNTNTSPDQRYNNKTEQTKQGYDNLTHTVGKGAATYFGGAAGNKLYDAASNTKAGKNIENAVSNVAQATSNPLTDAAVRNLNNSKAFDAANTAIDVASGGGSNPNQIRNSMGNRINPNMFKGSTAKSTSQIVSSNSSINQNSINRGHNLVEPPIEEDNSEIEKDVENKTNDLANELEKEQLEKEELEREQLEEQEQEEKKEKEKKEFKNVIKAILQTPGGAVILGGLVLFAFILFWFIWIKVGDYDIVGTGMKDYSQAKTTSNSYCNQIILVKEHDKYTKEPETNIDNVNLEETFVLDKQTVKRWSIKTYDLESYVAGVVQAEAINVHDKKTFEVAAMAARTYALQITSGRCFTWDNTNVREVYRNPQNFNEGIPDNDVTNAVTSTNGLVIMYKDQLLNMSDGNYYDYFCHIGKDQEKDERVFYQMLQENEEERLIIPIDWVKKNVNGDETKSSEACNGDFNCSGKYDHQCQPEGMSLYGAKYLLNKEADAYDTIRIIKYYYSYNVEIQRLQSSWSSLYSGGSCGDFSLVSTTLSKEDFIAAINNMSCSKEGCNTLKGYASQIYDMGLNNNVNPELVYTRAEVEGYSPGGSSYNYYGIGCTNSGGKKACKNYSSVMDGVLAFMNVMKGYEVNTLFDVYNVKHYAYIGSHWISGSSSAGGCYYLPYMAQYYTNQQRYNTVKNACDSGTGGSLATNDEDQAAYSHFQIEKMLSSRKRIFNIDSTNCETASADVNNILNSNASIGQKAAQLAVAKFDSFGYSQDNRWGDNQVDCSSLVYRTYSMLGINFGGATGSSGELAWCRSNNRMISESQLQPGDLLFKPGHVEIYIGNGQRFGAHTAKAAWADQVSIKPYTSGYFTEFCRPY